MPNATPSQARQAGFTLAELAVSLILIVEILLAALVVFDFNNRLTRVQTSVADVQQSLRVGMDEVAHWARMTGRGGLLASQPASAPPADPDSWHFLPRGVALEVGPCVRTGGILRCGNALPNTLLDPADLVANPRTMIMPDTDMLILRGVFTTPIYQIEQDDPTAFTLDNIAQPNLATSGTLRIDGLSPLGFSPQDLEPLVEAITNQQPEAIVLVSPLNARTYAVVELDPTNSVITGPAANPTSVIIAFRMPGGSGTAQGFHDVDYMRLAPDQAFPATLNRVAFAGVLEEYRFYVRASPGADGQFASRLSRARMFPNTSTPYQGDATNWAVDIVDDVIDLQVALGIDVAAVDAAGLLRRDNIIREAAPNAPSNEYNADEWLFNHWADNNEDVRWNAAGSLLSAVRITMVARTAGRDTNYVSPRIPRVEDSEYAEQNVPASEAERIERMARRRVLTTLIDLRNLG
jgi:hypothetical protein